MKFFDDMLDSFSAKDLRSRVTGVVIGGFIICIAAGLGLYFLLISTQEISIDGVGSFVSGKPTELAVSVPADDLKFIEDRNSVRIELMDPAKEPTIITAEVISINPAAPALILDAPDAPAGFQRLDRFDVKIILIEEPMWRMLWGRTQ